MSESRLYRRINTEKFISRAKIVHNDKYDYSLVDCNSSQSYISIICKEHGVFIQRASTHLRGHGCRKCLSEKQKLTLEEFKEKAAIIHNNKYSYEKVSSNDNNRVLTKDFEFITCPLHGDFKQQLRKHLEGAGCQLCARGNRVSTRVKNNTQSGWTMTAWKSRCKDNIGYLYIIRLYDDKENFIKIGRTNNFRQRKKMIHKFYNIEILEMFKDKAEIIYKLEVELHRKFKSNRYSPLKSFGGEGECFLIDLEEIRKVKAEKGYV